MLKNVEARWLFIDASLKGGCFVIKTSIPSRCATTWLLLIWRSWLQPLLSPKAPGLFAHSSKQKAVLQSNSTCGYGCWSRVFWPAASIFSAIWPSNTFPQWAPMWSPTPRHPPSFWCRPCFSGTQWGASNGWVCWWPSLASFCIPEKAVSWRWTNRVTKTWKKTAKTKKKKADWNLGIFCETVKLWNWHWWCLEKFKMIFRFNPCFE